MKCLLWGLWLCAWALPLLAAAQNTTPTPKPHTLPQAVPWPSNANLSGLAFLPPGLKTLNNDASSNPVSLWLDRGALAWADATSGPSCASCHGQVASLRPAVVSFPRLAADGKRLVNLEDQIQTCRTRSGPATGNRRDEIGSRKSGNGQSSSGQSDSGPSSNGQTRNETGSAENEEVLALSALLHQAAQVLAWDVKAPTAKPAETAAWQAHMKQGASQYVQRIGRMNLACLHCHDHNIGRQLRADVISPGHPTGFPVYRMSWQGLGSVERRLRACFSGVQAQMPPPGDPVLRELELYLKVRASGMPLEGPSIRR
jgi:sulfur-oxidizing protein SoxA